jgi:5-methylcytosine-specific restriction protein A
LRIPILKRDHYLCQTCLRDQRITSAHSVDHIVPKAEGGSDDPANLEAICMPCHRVKTQAESNRNRTGT